MMKPPPQLICLTRPAAIAQISCKRITFEKLIGVQAPSIKQRNEKELRTSQNASRIATREFETGLAEIHTLGRRVRLWLGPTHAGSPSRTAETDVLLRP